MFSADVFTQVCEAVVERTHVGDDRARESLSADVKVAEFSIVQLIESMAASLDDGQVASTLGSCTLGSL